MNVIVVGGGLSGLACARELVRRGASARVFEAQDYVGGRASTEVTPEGFRLDRGFQVLLTAYPEARRVFDYAALKLGRFLPGAAVRLDGRFHTVADPFRLPGKMLATLRAPVGSLGDKLRMALLALDARQESFGRFSGGETSTFEALQRRGFSRTMIDRFFRPFFGGIFLESELATSDRMFEFVFKMFSLGFAALPADGMGALGAALASELPTGAVACGRRVVRAAESSVELSSGETISADAVVVAADASDANTLVSGSTAVTMRGVYNFYLSAPRSPLGEPMLVLNGEGRGIINHLAVPSDAAPTYAPPGAALVSISVLESAAAGRPIEQLQEEVRAHAREWFGEQTNAWRPLGHFYVRRALPVQNPPYFSAAERPGAGMNGLFRCGDYLTSGSINGALASGRAAADAVIEATMA